MTANDPIPLTVIGGYLGAGKTTLVNRILRDPAGRRFGVIVNDVGEIAIDASLIDAVDGDTVTLSNGCVCCSLADGFAAALAELRAPERVIDHVIVEVSGVGDPWKVAQWGRTPGFGLDAVVVLADVETVRERARDRYVGETVMAQLAGADIVVATRLDLRSNADGELDRLQSWLRPHTSAPVISGTAGLWDHDPSPAPPSGEAPGRGPDLGHGHGEAHHAVAVSASPGATRADWLAWLAAAPVGVVRVKGFAWVLETNTQDAPGDHIVSVQLAGHRTEVLPWRGRSDVPESIVVICTAATEADALTGWLAHS